MATLYARIKVSEGKFAWKRVEFNRKNGRPKIPVGMVSYYAARDRSGNAKSSLKKLSTDLNEAYTLMLNGQINVSEEIAVPTLIATLAAGSWADLLSRYQTYLRLKMKKGALQNQSFKRYIRSLIAFDSFLAARNVAELKDITSDLIEIFKEYRIDEGAERAFRYDSNRLSEMFAWAATNQLVAKNPVKRDKEPKLLDGEGTQPYAAEDVNKLAAVSNGHGLVFWLYMQTGLRSSDIAALKWRDLDGGKVSRVAQKNGNRVNIPIDPELAQALETERKKRNPRPDDFVVVNNYGGPLTPNRLWERMQKLGVKAGVPKVNCRRFRCTFAVDTLMRGNSSEELAAYLGDSVAVVIKHYSPFVEGRQKLADAKRLAGRTNGLLTVAS
jgi:integrase